ncbi:MAG: glycerol-3-phosphate dehydrogenase/oxidase [bacterium]
MKRNLQQLANREHDVLVVGGGIYGAALAREVALCGLSTALIEKGDFCSATSANSLKIIHGGLRYLQQFDILRLRNSVVERRAFLRTAAHLVHPLPCLMPTQGHLMKGQEVMFCGLMLNEILSCDRNVLSDREKHIPAGRLISRATIRELVPGLSTSGLTGGCAWHDAYTYNSERLVTAMVRDAVEVGAVAANYVKLTGFHQSGGRVTGVRVHDERGDGDFDIPAKLVINAAGPWVNEVLALLGKRPANPVTGLALGMNFVLNRQLLPSSSAGLPFRRRAGESQRLLFLMPWRGRTLAGTYYRPHTEPADSLNVTERDIEILLSDLSHAYPAAEITRSDVAAILPGLLPVKHNQRVNDEPVLANHFSIINHARTDSIEGLISIVGVKYTTARDVAARTLRHVLTQLGRRQMVSGSDRRHLPGGAIPDFKAFMDQTQATQSGRLSPAVVEHLVYNYGNELQSVLELGQSQPDLLAPLAPSTTVIGAEVAFAAREEMAVTLADAVFRRTDLGSAGRPAPAALETASRIMATECGWNDTRRQDEVRKVETAPIFGDR